MYATNEDNESVPALLERLGCCVRLSNVQSAVRLLIAHMALQI